MVSKIFNSSGICQLPECKDSICIIDVLYHWFQKYYFESVHVFIYHENGVENYKLIFLCRAFFGRRKQVLVNLCADFEKCIHVSNSSLLPLNTTVLPCELGVKMCPGVLKIGWLINGVTLACIWAICLNSELQLF